MRYESWLTNFTRHFDAEFFGLSKQFCSTHVQLDFRATPEICDAFHIGLKYGQSRGPGIRVGLGLRVNKRGEWSEGRSLRTCTEEKMPTRPGRHEEVRDEVLEIRGLVSWVRLGVGKLS